MAILRIEFCATLPNTAFRTSLKKAAPALDTPSSNTIKKKWGVKILESLEYKNVKGSENVCTMNEYITEYLH